MDQSGRPVNRSAGCIKHRYTYLEGLLVSFAGRSVQYRSIILMLTGHLAYAGEHVLNGSRGHSRLRGRSRHCVRFSRPGVPVREYRRVIPERTTHEKTRTRAYKKNRNEWTRNMQSHERTDEGMDEQTDKQPQYQSKHTKKDAGKQGSQQTNKRTKKRKKSQTTK